MGYTLLQIGDILLKADRTMYRIGSIAYDDMFNALDEALDYNRDIIYIYKKAVEYADDFYVGTEKLDTVVEKLGQKVAAYDFGKLTPIYSDATVITGVVPSGAALNDLSDVTITNVQDNQILKYNSALGQWVNVGSGAAVRNRQQFTATLNQTVFVTSFPFSSSLLDVYLNGVKLSPPSYTTFGNYTITLADGSISDDIVEVIAYDGDTSFIDLSGYVPISRTLTINGVTYDLSTNRSWTVTGGVPYTGATGDVNLGEFGLSAGQLTLDTSPTGTAAVGTTRWNDTIGSSETTLKGGSVILKNGVDLVARVVNKVSPNTTLTKAAYQAVRVSGAQGQRLAVAFAQANNDANSADTIGLVTETIATNQEGFIITVGQLENINTTGSLQGETWVDGDVLYLSPTTAGAITKVKPTGNGHIVVIGYVEYAHANNGKIYVKVMNGWELDELHDVSIVTPANNEALIYESSTQLWKNKTIATALGYTPISGTGASGQVAYWNGTNSQTGSNNLFWDAANARLGIGINTPTNRVQILQSTISLGTQSTYPLLIGSGSDTMTLASRYLQSWNGLNLFLNSQGNGVVIGSASSTSYALFVSGITHISGNTLIGGSTDGGQRLQVYGDAFVKGSGNTGASNALSIQNSDGTALFQVTNGQIVLFNTARTLSGAMLLQSSGGGNTTGFTFGLLNPFTATSGSTYLITNASSFEPTSGTGTYTFLSARPTINQTGGANGITRGIHVQPTITAAADWRSIEWSNNSGWGLYGAGTANNYLNGSLGIGATSLTGYNLRVSKNITGATTFNAIYSDGIIQSDVTSAANIFSSYGQVVNTSFNLTVLRHFIAQSNSFGSANVQNQVGFAVGNTLTGASNLNIGFAGSIPNGTNRWNLYMDGTADNYLRGKLLINTLTVGTFDLDVNGTARVSGAITATNFQGAANVQLQYSGNNSYVRIEETGSSNNGIISRVNNTTNAFKFQHNNNYSFLLGYGFNNGSAWFGWSTSFVTTDASAQLQIDSTTKGFLPPRMTTTQKNAIASPTAGLMVFDTTLVKLCVHNGTTWETITSV